MLIDVVCHRISSDAIVHNTLSTVLWEKKRINIKANICSQQFDCFCIDVGRTLSKGRRSLTRKIVKNLFVLLVNNIGGRVYIMGVRVSFSI